MTAETATPDTTAPSATTPATHTGRDGKGIQVTEPAMKQLAALMAQAGVTRIVTNNGQDFRGFGRFEIVPFRGD